MVVLRFALAAAGKIILLPTVPLAALVVPLFTSAQEAEGDSYSWGGWWGTFDNPPQGDRGYVAKRSPFPGQLKGLKGYINRAAWMLRNPLYGYAKVTSIYYGDSDVLSIKGNPYISDKYKISGWMAASLRNELGKLKAFEFYAVLPWCPTRNLRIRLGWKIKTRKMKERGWARMVFTINPFDGYGNN